MKIQFVHQKTINMFVIVNLDIPETLARGVWRLIGALQILVAVELNVKIQGPVPSAPVPWEQLAMHMKKVAEKHKNVDIIKTVQPSLAVQLSVLLVNVQVRNYFFLNI